MTQEAKQADGGLKATPGPWRWWTSNSVMRLTCERREPGRINQDGGVLHAYRCKDGVADVCVSEADAHLIASAPELYEALSDAADEIDTLVEETIASVCVIRRDGFYDRSTADEMDQAEIARVEAIQAKVRSALAKARGEK